MTAKFSHLLLHLTGAFVFNFCFYYEANLFEYPDAKEGDLVFKFKKDRDQWGGHWKFLTVWSLFVHCIYYTMSAVRNLCRGHSHTSTSVISSVFDVLFAALSLPCSLLVSALFWTLFFVDKSLVFPEGYDQFYPEWQNQGVHTLPAALGLLDVLLVQHRFPSRRVSYCLLLAFILSYLGWTLYLGVVGNFWVYGVMKVLSWPGRVAFMATNSLLALGCHEIGRFCNGRFWPQVEPRGSQRKLK